MTRFRPWALLALALLLVTGTAAAQSNKGLYIGAAWGKTDVDASVGDVFDSVLDGDEDTQKYTVGWRFSNLIAVQGTYHDLGRLPGQASPCPPEFEEVCLAFIVPIQADTVAYSVSFVPQLPLTRSLFIFGKVGVVALETDVEAVLDDSTEFLENLSDEDIIYGAGLRLRLFSGLSIFYEYEFLGSDLETQALGAMWQF